MQKKIKKHYESNESKCSYYGPVLLSITLACVLLINSCSLAPKFSSPQLPVSLAYPVNNTPLSGSQSTERIAAAIPWREYFSDLYLQALIAAALENNRDLRSIVLRVQEAQAIYGIQRADQFPSVGLGAQESRALTPGDLNVTGRPRIISQYQVGVGLATWELDFWGRVRNLKDVALESYLATDEARRAATISLIVQVADGYLTLRELNERIVLARQTIASRERSFHIFTRRFEVGAISRMDLTQVETLLTQAQSLGVQLEQARAAQLHALTLLVGDTLPQLPEGSHDETLFQELRVGLPSDLLILRPDIIAAEHRLKAANANIGAARAAFFPRITLTGSFGTASAELDGLFETGSRAWSYVPSISLPIFDGGRNRAGLDLAMVRRDLAVVSYEKTIQTAFREVSDALSARQSLTKLVHIQQVTLSAQSERARLAKLRYDNGAAPYLEVLDAQRDLLVAEQQLVQTRRTLLSSHLSLYAALGGGSQNFSDNTSSNDLLIQKARAIK